MGCLDNKGPEINLTSLVLSMYDGKNLKNLYISPIKECRKKMLMMGIKWEPWPNQRRFATPMRKEEGS